MNFFNFFYECDSENRNVMNFEYVVVTRFHSTLENFPDN